jgi:predicted nucleotidyltransferase
MTQLIYDLIQRFEIINGVPTLISSNIQVIEGGSDLFSITQEWLLKNTNLYHIANSNMWDSNL